MKQALASLLVLCLCITFCSCGEDSKKKSNTKSNHSDEDMESSDDDIVDTTPSVVLSAGQKDSVEKTAKIHAFMDFNYEFVSVTHESLTVEGPYVTITGIVTFADKNGKKYSGEYTVVLSEKDEEDAYTTKSWELGQLMTEDGKPVDYFSMLYDYVIQKGQYDKTDKVSYIYEMGSSSNESLFLIAEDEHLRFWYTTRYETSKTSFSISYKCIFSKGEQPKFDFTYVYVDTYSNGIAIGGESSKVTGTIDINGNNLSVSTETYNDCSKSTIQSEIKSCHEDGVEFIIEIMNDAMIGCTLEQLIK